MIRFAALAAIALTLSRVAPSLAAAPSADDKFTAIFTREWAWRVQQDAAHEDHTTLYGPHLPDVGPQAEAARLTTWLDVRRQLDAIRPEALSPQRRVDYQVYRFQIDTRIAQQRFREYEKPLSSDNSFWNDFTYVARGAFRTEADYRNWIGQMNEVPRYFAQQIVNMRAGLARGFTPPRVTLEGRDASIVSVIDAPSPEENLFYTPFRAMPASMPAALQAELRAEAKAAIAKSVVPAYRTLLRFVRDDYIPHTRTTLGAEALPDGKAYYQSLIREYATVDMRPQQIHALGVSEGDAIRAEMQAVMTEVGFKGELRAFLASLRGNKALYATTPDQYLHEAAWIAKQVDGRIGTYLGHLPRRRFSIRPMPAEIAATAPSARGGPDGVLLNTYALDGRPLFALRALMLHESAPGHAMQIPLAMENRDQPDFRRQTSIAAFEEGWALYCERLGVEMGLYETPYDRFGMLTLQAWRAARLVVDTGVHALGWTRAQAQDYLRQNTALGEHEIETEVDRYIAQPGQALAYYIGERTIRADRARAEKALGARFNIRAFHDAVLELGSVPMAVIDARTDRFIAEGGKGPYPEEE